MTLTEQILILCELRVRISKKKRNVERVGTSKPIVQLVICGVKLACDDPEMTIGLCRNLEVGRVDSR